MMMPDVAGVMNPTTNSSITSGWFSMFIRTACKIMAKWELRTTWLQLFLHMAYHSKIFLCMGMMVEFNQ